MLDAVKLVEPRVRRPSLQKTLLEQCVCERERESLEKLGGPAYSFTIVYAEVLAITCT